MSNTYTEVLEELVDLLFAKVEALEEAEYQEDYDDLFSDEQQERLDTLVRLKGKLTPLPDHTTHDAKVTA